MKTEINSDYLISINQLLMSLNTKDRVLYKYLYELLDEVNFQILDENFMILDYKICDNRICKSLWEIIGDFKINNQYKEIYFYLLPKYWNKEKINTLKEESYIEFNCTKCKTESIVNLNEIESIVYSNYSTPHNDVWFCHNCGELKQYNYKSNQFDIVLNSYGIKYIQNVNRNALKTTTSFTKPISIEEFEEFIMKYDLGEIGKKSFMICFIDGKKKIYPEK